MSAIPLTRLSAIEGRKLRDTRAGFWLLAVSGLISVLIVTVLLFVDEGRHSWLGYFAATLNPMLIIVPIIAILAATAEWSQRTGMTTFALEPRRERVLLAKVIATCAAGVAALLAAIAVSALAHGIAVALRGAPADWGLTASQVLGILVVLVLSLLMGLGFGLMFLNTPAAIVAYLVVPTVWNVAGGLVSWLRDLIPWLDLGSASGPFLAGNATGKDWAHLGTASLLWVVIPLAVGVWRVRRTEVR